MSTNLKVKEIYNGSGVPSIKRPTVFWELSSELAFDDADTATFTLNCITQTATPTWWKEQPVEQSSKDLVCVALDKFKTFVELKLNSTVFTGDWTSFGRSHEQLGYEDARKALGQQEVKNYAEAMNFDIVEGFLSDPAASST